MKTRRLVIFSVLFLSFLALSACTNVGGDNTTTFEIVFILDGVEVTLGKNTYPHSIGMPCSLYITNGNQIHILGADSDTSSEVSIEIIFDGSDESATFFQIGLAYAGTPYFSTSATGSITGYSDVGGNVTGIFSGTVQHMMLPETKTITEGSFTTKRITDRDSIVP